MRKKDRPFFSGDTVKVTDIEVINLLTNHNIELQKEPIIGKVILTSHYEYCFAVDFTEAFEQGRELYNTHDIDGLITQPFGRYIEKRCLELVKAENAKYSDYARAIHEAHYVKKEGLIRHATLRKADNERGKETIRDLEEQIANVINGMNSTNKELADNEKKIKELEANLDEIINGAEKKYKKISQNKKIKKIEVGITSDGTFLIVTTKDLIIRDDEKGRFEPYNVGAFKIGIPLKTQSSIRIVNYKKQVQKHHYNHPCICEFSPCFGITISKEVKKLREEKTFDALIYLLIDS